MDRRMDMAPQMEMAPRRMDRSMKPAPRVEMVTQHDPWEPVQELAPRPLERSMEFAPRSMEMAPVQDLEAQPRTPLEPVVDADTRTPP